MAVSRDFPRFHIKRQLLCFRLPFPLHWINILVCDLPRKLNPVHINLPISFYCTCLKKAYKTVPCQWLNLHITRSPDLFQQIDIRKRKQSRTKALPGAVALADWTKLKSSRKVLRWEKRASYVPKGSRCECEFGARESEKLHSRTNANYIFAYIVLQQSHYIISALTWQTFSLLDSKTEWSHSTRATGCGDLVFFSSSFELFSFSCVCTCKFNSFYNAFHWDALRPSKRLKDRIN